MPVFDADAEVHALFAPGGAAVAAVAAAFPGCLAPGGGIDRGVLGRMVLGRPGGAAPARGASSTRWSAPARAGSCAAPAAPARALVVLDIPLLFETGGERPRRRRGRGLGQPDAAGASAPCAGRA